MKVLIALLCVVLNRHCLTQEADDSCADNHKSGLCNRTSTSTERIVVNIPETLPNVSNDISTRNEENSTRISGEISKEKCKEYAKYSYREIVSPVLSTVPQVEKLYECHADVQVPFIGKPIVPRKEVPHMVLLGFSIIRGQIIYVCGGNLISENFVLTAASCLFDPKSRDTLYVLFGVTDTDSPVHRQIIKVVESFRHPQYEEKTRVHNIGLAKLDYAVEINEFVRPACLNTLRNIPYRTGIEYEWGVHVIINGSRGIVKSVKDILPHDNCPDHDDDLIICTTTTSSQRNDPCLNFQGSSLVIMDHTTKKLRCMPLIIGLTIWTGNCGIGNQKVYTRVSEYIDWIEKIVWSDLL